MADFLLKFFNDSKAALLCMGLFLSVLGEGRYP